MKKILCLATAFVAITLATSLKADDKVITITKASDTMAKVAPEDGKGKPAMVKIKFDDGADWSVVKDTYTVSDSTAADLMNGKDYVSIGTDGTAGFHSTKWLKAKKMITGKE
jgi:hypothetical protein